MEDSLFRLLFAPIQQLCQYFFPLFNTLSLKQDRNGAVAAWILVLGRVDRASPRLQLKYRNKERFPAFTVLCRARYYQFLLLYEHIYLGIVILLIGV